MEQMATVSSNAFFTNKPEGMGMRLSISRSIIEAHGDHIWASAASPYGALLQFTLPAEAGSAA
jgi:signal transduction histidine kinase